MGDRDTSRFQERWGQAMPGYDLSRAQWTPAGNPYWVEQGNFEPGTYGQVAQDRPLVRLSPSARPVERQHEEAHVDQWWGPGGYAGVRGSYDPEAEARRYLTFGLTQDEAYGLAYGMDPIEVAARQAAGDPGQVFVDLQARIRNIEAQRAANAAAGTTARAQAQALGGIGDPRRR